MGHPQEFLEGHDILSPKKIMWATRPVFQFNPEAWEILNSIGFQMVE